jgi:hypothetical protein
MAIKAKYADIINLRRINSKYSASSPQNDLELLDSFSILTARKWIPYQLANTSGDSSEAKNVVQQHV